MLESAKKDYQLGVIGAGNLGFAIAQGAVRAQQYAPAQILLYNRDAQKRADHQAQGYAVTDQVGAVYAQCDIVILGCKPQNFDEVLPQMAQMQVMHKPLVLSIAAGVPFAKMQTVLGADCPIVRAMPNLPLTLGMGATALVKNSVATVAQLDTVRALFDAMGVTAVFDHEDMLNEVIPYNGSAPAYVYEFIDGMVKSATQHGIDEQDALRLFCHSLIGAATVAMQSGKPMQTLTDAVCSKGGTTIQAVDHLRAQDLSGILAQASDRCIARAYELGK